MEKKKMKKLVLKKDVVANLNDYHMNHLRGGSGYVCATIASIALTYQITNGTTVWAQSCGDTCDGTCDKDATCPGHITCNGANTCPGNATCPGTQCPASCNGTCGVSCTGVCNSLGC